MPGYLFFMVQCIYHRLAIMSERDSDSFRISSECFTGEKEGVISLEHTLRLFPVIGRY